MDQPLDAGSTVSPLQARGSETASIGAPRVRSVVAESGPGNLGKPVGAVVAAAKVLRTLHGSERPLNASEVARAAGLHRGTAYNILRTLQTEGFVGYDEATRSYSVSLRILELAYGVLRRSGLMDIARPLMHAVSDCAWRVGLPVQGIGALVAAAVGLGGRRASPRSVCHGRTSVAGPGGSVGHDHGRVRR